MGSKPGHVLKSNPEVFCERFGGINPACREPTPIKSGTGWSPACLLCLAGSPAWRLELALPTPWLGVLYVAWGLAGQGDAGYCN